jgi:hypothetical protein
MMIVFVLISHRSELGLPSWRGFGKHCSKLAAGPDDTPRRHDIAAFKS